MDDKQAQQAAAQIGSLPGFNGERQDPVLGGYHLGNGYRMYNPALRRFTSSDSMSPFGAGGINPYAYCAGDPINNTDPTGHVGMSMIGGLYLPDLLEGFSWSPDMINDHVMAEEEMVQEETGRAERHNISPGGHYVPGSSAAGDEAIPVKRARSGVASPVPGTSGTGTQQSVVRVGSVVQHIQSNKVTDSGWSLFMAQPPEERMNGGCRLGYKDGATKIAREEGMFYHYGIAGQTKLYDIIINPVARAQGVKGNFVLKAPDGYTRLRQETLWSTMLNRYGYKATRWEPQAIEPTLKEAKGGLSSEYIQWNNGELFAIYARDFTGIPDIIQPNTGS